MKVYLDNCCFNRPYDDQSQLRISLETQAKLHIQNLIKEKKLELASSYVLRYENSRNPHDSRKKAIEGFVSENVAIFVDVDQADMVKEKGDEIMMTGIKAADAYHVACAICSGCDSFLTTDDRLLKYKTKEIEILDPINFIRRMEGDMDE